MKYEKGLHSLSMNDITNSEKPATAEINNFVKNMTKKGYKFTDVIIIDEWFIDYVLDKDSCFIDWLLENKYVVEVEQFEPRTLTFDTKEEFDFLDNLIGWTAPAVAVKYMRGNSNLDTLKCNEILQILYNKMKDMEQ